MGQPHVGEANRNFANLITENSHGSPRWVYETYYVILHSMQQFIATSESIIQNGTIIHAN